MTERVNKTLINKYDLPLQENVIRIKKEKTFKIYIRDKRFTQFEEVKKFEDAYSKWQNCKYSVFVNSEVQLIC